MNWLIYEEDDAKCSSIHFFENGFLPYPEVQLGGSTANDIPDIGKFFADTKFALYVNNDVDTVFARSTIKAKLPRAATPNSDINQLFLSPVHAV